MSRIRRFFLRLLNTVRPGEPERQLQREVLRTSPCSRRSSGAAA